MALRRFWSNYRVLIVMGTSLGLIHWGWYSLKGNPLLHRHREEDTPEYVSPPLPAAAAKSK
uniref:PNAS-117 n=1 Tax=Amphilophus citrinellus TaxID=61819 RepID=A0A3Q0RW30_AMPCI